MKLQRCLDRHRAGLSMIRRALKRWRDAGGPATIGGDKFIIVCIDPPESINRQASWMSDFDDPDTMRVLQAVVDQSR